MASGSLEPLRVYFASPHDNTFPIARSRFACAVEIAHNALECRTPLALVFMHRSERWRLL